MDVKTMMEVPAQVREFAEKSIDQAEKAFVALMDAAGKSVSLMPNQVTDISKQALSSTEANVKAAFDHVRKLVNSKDMQEAAQLQADYLKSQFAAATRQLKQMGAGTPAAAADVTKDAA
jgi:phasin